ncbi:hypothetical protein [Nocardia jiangxiensis]|uniref:hypothetical protein n=1 Tax=Nocardia jiangxiensis TaxID=282685 RepID=UPI00031FFE05|nr:hypothetical protein [Nocardia jiangxiensis]
MDSVVPSPGSPRPPILARLHDAPTAHGLTIPFITLCHRQRRDPIWGAIDPTHLHLVFSFALCQVCGKSFGDRVVVLLRPQDWALGVAPEPGLHPECCSYAVRGCPVLAGRITHYRSRAAAARITRCDDPACECRIWLPPETGSQEDLRAGKPIDDWYAVWLDRDDYQIIHHHRGDENTPSLTGVRMRGVPLLAIRKIRDATPDPGQDESTDRSMPTVLDLLATQIALDRLTTSETGVQGEDLA